MAFAHSAQQLWMLKHHPGVARRWTAEEGKGGSQKFRLSPRSADSAKPERSDMTDFKMLVPSHVARHTPKRANEREAMGEGHGVSFQFGSRHRELGVPEAPGGFAGRDVKQAERKR
jgi:hypothetical protein